MQASLDTRRGGEVIKIEGRLVKNAVVVGSGALVGALAGRDVLGKDGAQKGMIVGAAAGAGAVILANMKEVSLPAGAELIIKLDEPLFIPKR